MAVRTHILRFDIGSTRQPCPRMATDRHPASQYYCSSVVVRTHRLELGDGISQERHQKIVRVSAISGQPAVYTYNLKPDKPRASGVVIQREQVVSSVGFPHK